MVLKIAYTTDAALNREPNLHLGTLRVGGVVMVSLTYAELRALNPCPDRLRAAAKLFGGVRKWGARRITASEAVAAGVSLDDLVWVTAGLARSDADVERRLRLWLSDCAAHVVHMFERECPHDMRPRDAIAAGRAFARGEIDNTARAAAWAAARAAAWAAARAAAGAAARAAAGDAARAAARATARAAAWAAAGAAAGAAAWAAEKQWQLDRLVSWLSEPEPDDWPLPAVVAAAAAE